MGKEKKKGVGDHLHDMLEKWGFKESKTCRCRKYRSRMNKRGPDWCERKVWLCVRWLENSARDRKLPFSRWLARWLVGVAIKRARKDNGEKEACENQAGKEGGDVRRPQFGGP